MFVEEVFLCRFSLLGYLNHSTGIRAEMIFEVFWDWYPTHILGIRKTTTINQRVKIMYSLAEPENQSTSNLYVGNPMRTPDASPRRRHVISHDIQWCFKIGHAQLPRLVAPFIEPWTVFWPRFVGSFPSVLRGFEVGLWDCCFRSAVLSSMNMYGG